MILTSDRTASFLGHLYFPDAKFAHGRMVTTFIYPQLMKITLIFKFLSAGAVFGGKTPRNSTRMAVQLFRLHRRRC